MMKVICALLFIPICCGLRLPIEKRLVYDFGMNTGSDTEAFLKQGFRVVAVEANPFFAKKEATKELVKDFVSNGDLKILNVGVKNDRPSSEEGLDFWIPDGAATDAFQTNGHWTEDKWALDATSGAASFSKYSACRITGSCHALKVPTKTCSDILRQEGTPYYMKVDIEGQDIECLKDVMGQRCGVNELPQFVSFENYGLDTFASYYGEGGKAKELMQIMHKKGYTGWKRARTWSTDYSNLQASGEDSSFGEDLLDLDGGKEWRPTSEFQNELGCDVDCDGKGYCKGWCDMHAKLDPSLASC